MLACYFSYVALSLPESMMPTDRSAQCGVALQSHSTLLGSALDQNLVDVSSKFRSS